MILDRIKQFIDFKGIAVSAFERSIGMSNASFGKSLKNGGAIGTDKLENFLKTYPEVSPTWLLTGKGNMLVDLDNLTAGQKEGIPLIPLSAMAGALTGERTVLEYECERYVIPAFSGADFLMPVKGNSMMPTYISGDIVACQRVPMTDMFFQWNKPYVLDTSQGAIIKRIKPGSDKQHVLIVSDNKEYDSFELSYSDIYAVALVIGIIRLE
jgi:phage repressor protein C with HTH and peptisase S24 domain